MMYTEIFDCNGNRRYSREFMHAWWVSLSYGPLLDPFSYDSFLAYCAGGEL
jgi:hypothetical protein